MQRTLIAAALGLLLALGAVSIAHAQFSPGRAGAEQRSSRFERTPAGRFDYYLLALSWSPTYCAEVGAGRGDAQCSRARPFAFVLHGLWPQYERGWPQDCASPDRGFVPREVAERMLDIMPSPQLIFHSYRKHGTCSGLGVEGYFDLARQLYRKVAIPARFAAPTDGDFTISPSELIDAFLAANPHLDRSMIAVSCAGSGHRLREVRICFDKSGAFRACGANENQHRLCSAERMYVPPVRPSRRSTSPLPGGVLLPGPRDDSTDDSRGDPRDGSRGEDRR